jgi:flagellar motor switch protein FliN/FliY
MIGIELSADIVRDVAAAAMANIPVADELTVGQPATDTAGLRFAGQAVSARFTGRQSGEVVIAVEQPVVDALQNSPLGALDVTAALAPALQAAAQALGGSITAPGALLDPALALDALLAKPAAIFVPLEHLGQIRAIVGLVVNAAVATPEPAVPDYPTKEQLQQRLAAEPAAATPLRSAHARGMELLRDVAMDVTAQIGSTRMTVNELLTLADGTVIELDRSAGAPADLLVNGHLIARGEVVVIDENFGLRITEIVADGEAAATPA